MNNSEVNVTSASTEVPQQGGGLGKLKKTSVNPKSSFNGKSADRTLICQCLDCWQAPESNIKDM